MYTVIIRDCNVTCKLRFHPRIDRTVAAKVRACVEEEDRCLAAALATFAGLRERRSHANQPSPMQKQVGKCEPREQTNCCRGRKKWLTTDILRLSIYAMFGMFLFVGTVIPSSYLDWIWDGKWPRTSQELIATSGSFTRRRLSRYVKEMISSRLLTEEVSSKGKTCSATAFLDQPAIATATVRPPAVSSIEANDTEDTLDESVGMFVVNFSILFQPLAWVSPGWHKGKILSHFFPHHSVPHVEKSQVVEENASVCSFFF